MADDLSVAVERLRTSTQRLNAICDGAAQLIRDVENYLADSHVGLPAWVEVKRLDDGPDATRVMMSYERHASGKFRILVTHVPHWAEGVDDVHPRPWSECGREDKLDSLEKLPDLLLELAKQIDERTAKAEKTVSAVRSQLQLPKKKGGD